MRVAIRINAEIRSGPRCPTRSRFFTVPHDMQSIFGETVFVGFGPRQQCGSLVKFRSVPSGIAGKTFVLGAHAVLIPTGGMPRVIHIADQLRNFSRRRVTRIIGLSVDSVMHARRNITALQVGNGSKVIALHVVLDEEFFPVTGGVPFAGTDRTPNGGAVIGAPLGTRNDRSDAQHEHGISKHGFIFRFHNVRVFKRRRSLVDFAKLLQRKKSLREILTGDEPTLGKESPANYR